VVAGAAVSSGEARITVTLNQIPLGEALRYVANQVGLKVKVEPYAVAIIPLTEQSDDLITKEYRVRPILLALPCRVARCCSAALIQKRQALLLLVPEAPGRTPKNRLADSSL
jgi:hypothetical protein